MVCGVQGVSGEGFLQSGGVKGSSISSASKEMLKDWDVATGEAAGCDNMSQHPWVVLEGILVCLVGQNG